MVGHADIVKKLGVSRRHASKLAERPDFPPVVMRTASGPLYLETRADAFAASDWRQKPGPKASR